MSNEKTQSFSDLGQVGKAMSVRKTKVTVNGKTGYIIHDKLVADGPVDENGNPFPLLDEKGNIVRDENGDVEPMPGENDDMAQYLHDYVNELRSQVLIDNVNVARYGPITLISQSTPIFCYDHPALLKIASTAFTDGINVFIAAPFMRKLLEQEIEHNGRRVGVIPLLIHEVMHKMYNHVTRLQSFPPIIANIAEDYVINAKAVHAFPQLNPVPLLLEVGFGYKPEESNKYIDLAEETVAKMLLNQQRKKQEQKQKQQKQSGSNQDQQDQQEEQDQNQQDQSQSQPSGQGQGSGKSQSGKQPSSGGEDKKDSSKPEKGDSGQGEGDEMGDESNIHHISPEELVKILEEEGLQNVRDSLDMPSSDDVEGMATKKEENAANMSEAIQNALAEAQSVGMGKYPGGHMAQEAQELLGNLQKGKLSWKLGLKRLIQGNGNKGKFSMDSAHTLYYLDPVTLNGHEPYYDGSLTPHEPEEVIACIMDTSGSTSMYGQREAFASEILGLKKSVNRRSDSAKEVVFVSADTVIRGELQFITDQNVNKILKEGLGISGNGGTDFRTPLLQLIAHPTMKKKKIKTVLYFTDCEGYGPAREEFKEFLDGGGKIAFFTTPSTWNEEWNRNINYAEVYCIEEGTAVDLTNSTTVNKDTRRNRLK